MPKLTTTERHEFLQERGHLARIATIKPDGSPSVVPVWFICQDGKILITPRKHSAFYANVQHDPLLMRLRNQRGVVVSCGKDGEPVSVEFRNVAARRLILPGEVSVPIHPRALLVR